MNREERIAKVTKVNLKLQWLGGYSDAYILVSVTIKIRGEWDNDAAKRAGGRIKGVIFKNCASFTGCISNITK